MMKARLMLMAVFAASTTAAFAATDRIDVYEGTAIARSIMVDDIKGLTVSRATAASDDDGYTLLNIYTAAGIRQVPLSGLGQLVYRKADETTYHEITRVDAEGSKVMLLDWRNNSDVGPAQIDPSKPADYRACVAGGIPHFLLNTTKGFAAEYKITGDYTGKVYTDNPNFVWWSEKTDNLLSRDCFAFEMPFEPVTLSAEAWELDTYVGNDFLGLYTGYRLEPLGGRLAVMTEPVLSAEFLANGTYKFKTTDQEAFDVFDLYDWFEETNTFSYVPYEGDLKNIIDLEVTTGVTGNFTGDGLVFATFHNIVSDLPENNRRYIAAKSGFNYTVVSADEFNNVMLLQVEPTDGGDTHWYYINRRGGTPEELAMRFTYGSSIGANSTGWGYIGDDCLFKYDYKGHGDPTFVFRGAEFGSYTGADGEMILDGFGKAAFGGREFDYTIEGGVVTMTIDGEVRTFTVDRDARTYVENIAAVWTGALQFVCEEALGAYAGGAQTRYNTITIDLDKDFAGNTAIGTAAVRINISRNDGFLGNMLNAVASTGAYVYNPAAKTITITNLYMGTSATTSTRRNLTLNLSDDLTEMWIDDSAEDRIYSTSRDGSYVLTGRVNTLSAPKSDVSFVSNYYGEPVFSLYGQQEKSATTMTLDLDAMTASLEVIGMDTQILAGTCNIEIDDTTLTLKDFPEADPSTFGMTTRPVDLVFTLGVDGNLTGEQTLTGYMTIEVDFSSAPLVSAE